MKSEPDEFSILDLQRDGVTFWSGVRNYQARNNIKQMNVGDEILFYHSSANPIGVAGLATVNSLAEPDTTAFDSKNPYFDPKSKKESPRWYGVQVRFKQLFPRFIDIESIKKDAHLKDMVLLKNSRLSVQPVTESEYRRICRLGDK